jgi:Cu-Zn family superoxide dismutase
LSFLTNRFTLDEIIGRVIIIHDKPDDFTSQPSGNSGNKIACGKIVAM